MIKRFISSLVTIVIAIVMIANPVLAAYSATITLTQGASSTYSTAIGSFIYGINNLYLRDSGYMSSTGLDTRVVEGSTELPHLVVDNGTLFATTISANTTKTMSYTFGNSALSSFKIMTGKGGNVTIVDDATIEPTNQTATWETIGYWNTGAGNIGKTWVSKEGALTYSLLSAGLLKAEVTGGENVTASVSSGYHNVTAAIEKIPGTDPSISFTDTTYNGTASNGNSPKSIQRLADNKLVIGYYDNNQSKSFVKITEGDGTGAMTFGTPVEVSVANQWSIATLDSDHFVVSYQSGIGDGTKIYTQPFSVSGTTITAGNAIKIEDIGWEGTPTIAKVTNSKLAVFWSHNVYPYSGYARVGSLAFPDITLGEQITFVSGLESLIKRNSQEFFPVYLEDDKIAITYVYSIYPNHIVDTKIITVASLTATAGTALTVKSVNNGTTGDDITYAQLTSLSSSRYAIAYEWYTSSPFVIKGNVTLLSVSGSTITNEDDAILFSQADGYGTYDGITLIKKDASSFYATYEDAVNEITGGQIITISDTTMTVSDFFPSDLEYAHAGYGVKGGALLNSSGYAVYMARYYNYFGAGADEVICLQSILGNEGSDPVSSLNIQVDSGIPTSTTLTVPVPDTANNFVILDGYLLPYTTSFRYYINGIEKVYYEPNTIILGTTLPNRDDEGTNDGIIYWGANENTITIGPGDFSVDITGFDTSVSGANNPPDFAGDSPGQGLATGGTEGTGFLFYGVFKPWIDTYNSFGGNQLSMAWIWMAMGTFMLFVGCVIAAKTRSLFGIWIAATGIMVLLCGNGIFDWWVFWAMQLVIVPLLFLLSRGRAYP